MKGFGKVARMNGIARTSGTTAVWLSSKMVPCVPSLGGDTIDKLVGMMFSPGRKNSSESFL